MVTCSRSGTFGTLSVSIDRITTLRCRALLCSTMGFTTADGKPLALVYLYKRGTFYPFVPLDGEKRDNALELQIRGVVGEDVPVEPDLTKWLAIWGAPGLG